MESSFAAVQINLTRWQAHKSIPHSSRETHLPLVQLQASKPNLQ